MIPVNQAIVRRFPQGDAHDIPFYLAFVRSFHIIVFVQRDAEFRWIGWNREHATQHGCTVVEIESVVRNAGHGWPRRLDRAKYVIEGRGQGNRMVRIIYLKDPEGTFFVIHAMPLTTRRRRRGR
jgi:hypothetical protein